MVQFLLIVIIYLSVHCGLFIYLVLGLTYKLCNDNCAWKMPKEQKKKEKPGEISVPGSNKQWTAAPNSADSA